MQYMVIWPDGQKFGPADLNQLNQWAAEGRIKPETELESVVDGARLSAASLPGIVFPGAAAAQTPTPTQPADEGSSVTTSTGDASSTDVFSSPTPAASSGSGDQYFVIGPDGNKYGPADPATLTQWAAENRLSPTSMLEEAATGVQIEAQRVSGIIFPVSAGASQSPLKETGFGANEGFGGGTVQSNYPRPDLYGGALPEEIRRKFNWGAFLMNWIWGLNHKYPLALVALALGFLGMIPLVGLLFSIGQLGFVIWLGIKGNEIAWNSGRFSTVEEMLKCQRIWAWWGLGIVIAGCLCGIGAGVMLAMSGAAMDPSMMGR